MPPTPNIKQSFVAALLIIGAAIYALIGIAHPPEGLTITNEAVSTYLFKTGQRMVARSNTTETIVQSDQVAASIHVSLSSSALVGNGTDSCRVVASILDVSGNPVPDGQPVEFWTLAGTFTNGNDTLYTLSVGGMAVASLRSSLLQSGQPVQLRVGASTIGVGGNPVSQSQPVLFYAGALKGKIASGSGSVIRGMRVVLFNQNEQMVGSDTTDDQGNYVIPVSQSGMYRSEIKYVGAYGDEVVIRGGAGIIVPAIGGTPAVAPLCAIAGNILDIESGRVLRRSDVPVMLYRTSESLVNEGRTLPAIEQSDARGGFVFDSIAAGSFELLVTDLQYSGRVIVPQLSPGTFYIDVPLRLADAPAIEITKTSNKRLVEIGDVVTYSIGIRNITQNSVLTKLTLVDKLPVAFVYASHSGLVNGASLPEPTDKRKLEWSIADSLLPGAEIKIMYAANVGSAALDGDGTNRAYVIATDAVGREHRSIEATARVTVRPGVFSDRGIIIGKIFYDDNEDGEQDDGEKGIRGVELWMEDGTRITTGDDGKYSLPEVRAGQHVLRVNDLTLPFGAEVLALKVESARDGISRFVRLTESGIARADFYVRRPRQASAEVMIAAGTTSRIPSLYVLRFDEIDTPNRILLSDTLAPGFVFDYTSITWRGTKLYPKGEKSNVLAIDFQKRPANSIDSIYVEIVADSMAFGKQPATRGRLILGYPLNRDAVFPVVQSSVTFMMRAVATNETAPVQDLNKKPDQQLAANDSPAPPLPQERVDSATARKSPATSGALRNLPTKKRPVKHPGSVEITRQDTARQQSTGLQEASIAEKIGDGRDESFDSTIIGGAALLLALLVALILILYRKRRKSEGGES